MISRTQFTKIFSSLSFQLPAVVFSVFLGILFLLMLFFHEMTIILVKTRQLAQSAEVNDYVSSWLNTLSSSARERTKLMSLGNESYLHSFELSLNEINDSYSQLERIYPDSMAASTRELRNLHEQHLEYLELLDNFSKQQMAKLSQQLARASEPPAPQTITAPLKAVKETRATRPGKNHKQLSLVTKKKGRKYSNSFRTIVKPKKGKIKRNYQDLEPLNAEPVKQIELDTATNETFKAYEQSLREGLFQTQEVMRWERNDKLLSLRNSVGRAKDRLIYSLILLLAMVGYVGVILKWKILDPMKSLKNGVVEIGQGSLGYQVSVKTRNEIGELASVFNRMSTQLEEKHNAEVRLRRLEAIEQIVRSVNHEINNPLMIISGNTEYLLAVFENSDESLKSKLNSILGEVRRIFTVTQRLKEIKEPVTESYIGGSEQMIDLLRSSQIRKRDF